MKKKWQFIKQKLDGSLNDLEPVLQSILYSRGITDRDEINRFLSCRIQDLHSPFLMKDMGKAVDRILTAIESGEKIIVYGDYDVDGITSTALLFFIF